MTLPTIVVGIGNTMFRLATADQGAPWPIAWRRSLALPIAQFDPAQIVDAITEEAVHWCVASVHRPTEQALSRWVTASRSQDLYSLYHYSVLPINVSVALPERVGMDRLVAAVGVNRLRKHGQPAIVVDAGTAVNVDLIDAQGSFCGGTIFPGVNMMARALAHDTDLLPEIRFEGSQELPALVGAATVPAIRSGLFYGTVGAIGEIVRRYQDRLDREAAVYLTGGDAGWLTQHLASDHTVVADLGLQGIAAVAMDLATSG